MRSDKTVSRLNDVPRLTQNAFNYLFKFIVNMKKGEATVQLHKALSAIVKFAGADGTLASQTQKAAETILRNEWSDSKEMKVCLMMPVPFISSMSVSHEVSRNTLCTLLDRKSVCQDNR